MQTGTESRLNNCRELQELVVSDSVSCGGDDTGIIGYSVEGKLFRL